MPVQNAFQCPFSEKGREILGTIAAVINVILVLSGCGILIAGWFYNYKIESKFALLEGYNAYTLAFMLMTEGAFMMFIHSFGMIITYDCRSYVTRKKLKNALFPFVLISFCFGWVLFVSFIMCFAHKSVIEKAFNLSLTNALHAYKLTNSIEIKASVDRLQMEYHCCGAAAYTDWFTTSWISTNWLNVSNPNVIKRLKQGEFFVDDVPFSCCDIGVVKPCIHHGLTDKTRHRHYAGLSIYEEGCTSVFLDYAMTNLLIPLGISMLVAWLLEVAEFCLSRYLQTSIDNLWHYSPGNPCGVSPGYLVKYLVSTMELLASTAPPGFQEPLSSTNASETSLQQPVSGNYRTSYSVVDPSTDDEFPSRPSSFSMTEAETTAKESKTMKRNDKKKEKETRKKSRKSKSVLKTKSKKRKKSGWISFIFGKRKKKS